MCGRSPQAYTWAELVALYGLTQPAMNLQPRYNIAPTATIDVLIPRGADRLELWASGWGLLPRGGRRRGNGRGGRRSTTGPTQPPAGRCCGMPSGNAAAASRLQDITSGNQRRPASSPTTF